VLNNDAGTAIVEVWGGSGIYEIDLGLGGQNDGGSGSDAGGEPETATEVDLAAGSITGQLGGEDSEDNYTFTAEGPGTLTMSAPTASGNYSFRLHEFGGSSIATATAGPGGDGTIDFDVPADTVLLIEIWNADGPYELSLGE